MYVLLSSYRHGTNTDLATDGFKQRLVSFQMPTDPHAFILEHKDRDIDGESRHSQAKASD